MPESKPIKKQIEKIDRVTYPFSLPQTWDEDAQDWKITSKKNPLPSGNFFLKDNLWVPVSEQDPLPVKQEQLINRIEAIEDTLESVVENGAINTQLTGSSVEDGIPVKVNNTIKGEVVFEEIEISSGSTFNTPPIDVDFNYYTTYVRALIGEHNFAVTISFMADVYNISSVYVETEPLPHVVRNRNHTTGIKRWETYTGAMRWNIENKSDETQTYLVVIWRFD